MLIIPDGVLVCCHSLGVECWAFKLMTDRHFEHSYLCPQPPDTHSRSPVIIHYKHQWREAGRKFLHTFLAKKFNN